MNLHAKYEEDTAYFKDSHSRALDELSRKHRAALENTQSVSEKERNRLLSVSELCHNTHIQLSQDSQSCPVEISAR